MPSVTFSGEFGQRHCFGRDGLEPREIQHDAWGFARTVIDHGCFFFTTLLDCDQTGLGIRDWVVMALLRRILITGEAIRSLLESGLGEPASATSRTLLELERNLRLVLADSSDGCARRLAVYGILKSRRHFEKAPRNPLARQWLFQDEAFFEWFKQRSRTWRDWLKSNEEAVEDVRQANDWHGFKSQEEAFEKAGMPSEYYLSGFEGTSLFVHATNIDYDFHDTDDGKIRLKPFARSRASDALGQLGELTLRLIGIYMLIWEDKGRPEYQKGAVVEDEHGNTGRIPALTALQALAIEAFPDDPAASDGSPSISRPWSQASL